MKKTFQLSFALAVIAFVFVSPSMGQNGYQPTFQISYPETSAKGPLDGRLLLLISTSTEGEPRFQINEDLNTQQVFGLDVEGWRGRTDRRLG